MCETVACASEVAEVNIIAVINDLEHVALDTWVDLIPESNGLSGVKAIPVLVKNGLC